MKFHFNLWKLTPNLTVWLNYTYSVYFDGIDPKTFFRLTNNKLSVVRCIYIHTYIYIQGVHYITNQRCMFGLMQIALFWVKKCWVGGRSFARTSELDVKSCSIGSCCFNRDWNSVRTTGESTYPFHHPLNCIPIISCTESETSQTSTNSTPIKEVRSVDSF